MRQEILPDHDRRSVIAEEEARPEDPPDILARFAAGHPSVLLESIDGDLPGVNADHHVEQPARRPLEAERDETGTWENG